MALIDIIVSVLVSGSVCGSIGFALGLGLRPGLQLRIESFVHDLIKVEIDNFVGNLKTNPKFVKDLSEPFITVISKQFGAENEGGSMKDLKIGGFKIPAWLVQAGLGMVQQNKRGSLLPPGLEDLTGR